MSSGAKAKETEVSEAGGASRVVKFGGSSVTGVDRIDTIAAVTRDRLGRCRPVLVVSAFAKVTATLERMALAAARGDETTVELDRLFALHRQAVRDMAEADPEVLGRVDRLLADCARLISEIAAARACSPPDLDHVLSFGERLSSQIVTAALVRRGIPAECVDAAHVVVTDANHGNARADFGATRRRVVSRVAGRPGVPVVTGFLGATEAGVRTTLGREGSDYTGAVLASCLTAEGLEIWTDVDGIMTADPRIVPDAHPLRHLSYDELFDLTSWGAKVVHPKTVEPLREQRIPLTIRNTGAPSDAGTTIGPSDAGGRSGPLGVTCVDLAALRAPGHGTPSTAETRRRLEGLLGALDAHDTDASIVTVVGRRASPLELDARAVAEALAEHEIGAIAVAEPVPGRIVSVAVRRRDADAALRAAHRAAFARIPSGPLHA